ncbi:hypothetical protein [Larkinella punicea]|uniref:Uncharacterized protein n=1 Tax=Larkinella punicea TaxID=2315727 RepID=A0A368JLL7_9BACT|nr:hypothetical protein [Larkinella punicea]RCR68537.1 hypothetical protein DUE52_15570 [Larkinella punicea]
MLVRRELGSQSISENTELVQQRFILTTQRYAVEVDREIQGEAMVSIWEDGVKGVKQVGE